MAAGAYFAWLPRDPHTFIAGMLSFPEAASLAVKRGTPVVIDTNGRIDLAPVTFTSVFGVTAEDAHNGTAGANNILVWPIRQMEQWRVPLITALAQTNIADEEVGFVGDTASGYWGASTTNTGAQGRVVDYVQGPAGLTIGDTLAPVYVVFHATKLQVV